MYKKLKILTVSLITIIIFCSCSFSEKKKLNGKINLKDVTVNKCKKGFSLYNNSSFNEILDSVGDFSYHKQLFVQKNIGKLFGTELSVDDVFIYKSNYYISASIGVLNSKKIILKTTSEQAKKIKYTHPFMKNYDEFFIFRLEGIKLLNHKDYFVEDESIEEGKLEDYLIKGEEEVKLLFLGTLIKKCN